MKIKADYVNAPQWREMTVKSRLPEQLKCLDELAHNMWWAWNYEARDLWRSLDEKLYEEVGHNPVVLLERLSYDRKEEIVGNKTIMKKLRTYTLNFANIWTLSQILNAHLLRISVWNTELIKF